MTYLLHVLLRAAVDIAAGAALAEKARKDVTQGEQTTVAVAATHDCLVAFADSLRGGGLFTSLAAIIGGHGKG
jgi:hypothetical protein